jgi:uncharacterized protein (DUF2147 family)
MMGHPGHMKRTLSIVAALLAFGAAPVFAGNLLGTWLSPRDHKGQVGHMQLSLCGDAICGKLVRVFDRSGNPIVTPNVGKQLVWDMKGSGDHYQGQVYVPLMKGNFPAEMKVSGSRLTVRGCSKLGICKAQTWTKVH